MTRSAAPSPIPQPGKVIEIWQVPWDLGTRDERFSGEFAITKYRLVFSGTAPVDSADDVFRHFNRLGRGSGHYIDILECDKGPLAMTSLSVGDVVIINGRALRCAGHGWDDLTAEWRQQEEDGPCSRSTSDS